MASTPINENKPVKNEPGCVSVLDLAEWTMPGTIICISLLERTKAVLQSYVLKSYIPTSGYHSNAAIVARCVSAFFLT